MIDDWWLMIDADDDDIDDWWLMIDDCWLIIDDWSLMLMIDAGDDDADDDRDCRVVLAMPKCAVLSDTNRGSKRSRDPL